MIMEAILVVEFSTDVRETGKMIANYLPKGPKTKVSEVRSADKLHVLHILSDDFNAVLGGLDKLKIVENVVSAACFGPGQLFPIKEP